MLRDLDQVGWQLSKSGQHDAKPPVNATIEAVGLLIREATSNNVATGRHAVVWYTMISELFFSPNLMGWFDRSSIGRTPKMENARMSDDKIVAADEVLENELKAVLSRQDLAEAAFPDKQIRENIVPLFQHFRKIGQKASHD